MLTGVTQTGNCSADGCAYLRLWPRPSRWKSGGTRGETDEVLRVDLC